MLDYIHCHVKYVVVEEEVEEVVVVPKEALIRKLEVPDVRVKEHRVLGHHSKGVSYRVLF